MKGVKLEKLIINGRGLEKIIGPTNPFPDKHIPSYDYEKTTKFLSEARQMVKETKIGQKEATWIPELMYPTLPFAISLMSDMHYGSTNVDYELLDKHFKIVEETPNFFLATNGDHIDNFNAVKFPDGMYENPLPPNHQAKALFKKLLDLDKKDKVAVVAHGNNDLFGHKGGQDFFETFASEMKAPVFTQGGTLDIVTASYTYKMILNHTYWGKSKINITNAPKRLMEYENGDKTADIGWLGHTHQSSFEHFSKGGKDVVAVVSGTYKVDDPWAAKIGLGANPGKAGTTLVLYPDQRKMEVFKDMESAQDYILGLIFIQELLTNT